MEKLKNSMQNLGISIGEAIIPVIEPVVEYCAAPVY